MTCPGRTVDRWRTVWNCELEPHESGLCRCGVIQWSTPGIGDVELSYRLRVKPTAFFQWTADLEIDEAPAWLNAVSINPDFDSLVVRVPRPDGGLSVRHLLAGDWAIQWSDGVIDVRARDRFEAMFEATHAAE